MPPRTCAKVIDKGLEVKDRASNINIASKNTAVEKSMVYSNDPVIPVSIMRMPIDVFAEIAKYLAPIDLLQLARTSRHWRALMMSRSSVHVWATARGALGLQNCPDDLSEPQFADLLFGKGCTLCAAPETQGDAILELRVRLCVSCEESQVLSVSELMTAHLSTNHFKSHILTMVPHVWLNRDGKKRACMLRSQFQAVLRRMETMSPNSQKWNSYIAERKAAVMVVFNSVYEIGTSLRAAAQQKEFEEKQTIKRRQMKIIEKLTTHGYSGQDFDSMFDEEDWKWRTHIFKSVPLTEKEWATMEPELLETIRLRREFATFKFDQYRQSLRQGEMKARFSNFRPQLENFSRHKLFLDVDLLELPVVKELVDEDRWRIPLTDERWLAVQVVLVNATRTHAEKIEADCLTALHAAGAEVPKEHERAYWFKIDAAIPDENPSDDQVPSCLLAARAIFEQEFDGSTIFTSYVDMLRRRATDKHQMHKAWNQEIVTSSGQVIRIALMLLRCLGLPDQTSWEYMKKCGSAFECTRCGLRSMNWPGLVNHFQIEYNKIWAEQRHGHDGEKPLPNDHSLEPEDFKPRNLGPPVSMLCSDWVETAGTYTGNGRLYSQLADTWNHDTDHRDVFDQLDYKGEFDF